MTFIDCSSCFRRRVQILLFTYKKKKKKKKKKTVVWTMDQVRCVGTHSLLWAFKPERDNPIRLAYGPR